MIGLVIFNTINFSNILADPSRKSVSPTKAVNDLNKQEEISTKSVVVSSNKVVEVKDYSESDVLLLAKLIQAEALSESYEGKVAVGSVVVNRIKFNNATLEQVIFAKNQFSSVNNKLFKREPNEECINAAEEALDGNKPVGDSLYFLDLNKVSPSWLKNVELVRKIGEHWFFKRK